MNAILGTRHLRVLADFAHSRVLVGFDFDGTLAPIVATPSRARMRATTRRLLWSVATLYPAVVISGRSRRDLVNRLGRLPLQMFGNYGMEPDAEQREASLQVREWVRVLRQSLAGRPGVVVQDKRYSATVHYRHAPDLRLARDAIRSAVERLPNVRVLQGDRTVNLLFRTGAHKGLALQRARRVARCAKAIFVGDDGVDEDAFASGAPDRLLAIRVGPARASCAPFYLRSQSEIDRLLQRLVLLRSARADRAGGRQ